MDYIWSRSFLLLILLALSVRGGSKCPKDSSILPCKCSYDGSQTNVVCDDINFKSIRIAIKVMSNLLMKIDKFTIITESAYRLPFGLFLSNKITKAVFETPALFGIENSAFVGQEQILESLQIRSSQLSYVPVHAIARLRKLKKFEMLWAPKLHNLKSNLFLRMRNPSSIEELRINRANISLIGERAFQNLIGLKILDLSNNKIKLISSNIFDTSHRLKEISLKNNLIKDVDVSLLKTLYDNGTLNLEHNKISTITDASLLHLAHSSLKMNVQDNRINCDCNMKYIGKLNSALKPRTIGLKGYCSTPVLLRDIILTKLRKTDFINCYGY